MTEERYRLVTRSDFDGLVCAVLLRQLGLVDEIVFVHPKDVQDGMVEIGPSDITTNLPYSPQAHLVFDHHHSETLRNPEERVDLYHQQAEAFAAQLRRCTSLRGSVAVVDLRQEAVIHAGNRFPVYALFPQCLVSLHVLWGKQRQNTVIAAGKSILKRASTADLGALMLAHGGGGHLNAGTCQVPHDQADHVVEQLVGQPSAANPARV